MNMAPYVSQRILLVEALDFYMWWFCIVTLAVMFLSGFVNKDKRPNLRFGMTMAYCLMGMVLMLYMVWRTWRIMNIYELP